MGPGFSLPNLVQYCACNSDFGVATLVVFGQMGPKDERFCKPRAAGGCISSTRFLYVAGIGHELGTTVAQIDAYFRKFGELDDTCTGTGQAIDLVPNRRYCYVCYKSIAEAEYALQQISISSNPDISAAASVTSPSTVSAAGVDSEELTNVGAATVANQAMFDCLGVRKLCVKFADLRSAVRAASQIECTSSTAHIEIPGLWLQPDFITASEEEALLLELGGEEAPWKESLSRRVQHYGFPFNYRTLMLDYSRPTPPLPVSCVDLATRILSLVQVLQAQSQSHTPHHSPAAAAAAEAVAAGSTTAAPLSPPSPPIPIPIMMPPPADSATSVCSTSTGARGKLTNTSTNKQCDDPAQAPALPFNQLTINEYLPGQGIASHTDTAACLGPVIGVVNLGSGIVMNFMKNEAAVEPSRNSNDIPQSPAAAAAAAAAAASTPPSPHCTGSSSSRKKHVYLPARSLLLLSGEARYEWSHGIAPRRSDCIPSSSSSSSSSISSNSSRNDSSSNDSSSSSSSSNDSSSSSSSSNDSSSNAAAYDEEAADAPLPISTTTTVTTASIIDITKVASTASSSSHDINNNNHSTAAVITTGSSPPRSATSNAATTSTTSSSDTCTTGGSLSSSSSLSSVRVPRGRRLSLTFRHALRPAALPRSALLSGPSSSSSSSTTTTTTNNNNNNNNTMQQGQGQKGQQHQDLELDHVVRVYDSIAVHWNHTRGRRKVHWHRVKHFLEQLPAGALLADVGSGDGKYFGVNPAVVTIGCDRSWKLLDVSRKSSMEAPAAPVNTPTTSTTSTVATAATTSSTSSISTTTTGATATRPAAAAAVGDYHETFCCDAVALPLQSDMFDATICIAVLHHLSSVPRRHAAIRELLRVTRVGGEVFLQAWAYEQATESKRTFDAQDTLVPWRLSKRFYLETLSKSATTSTTSTTRPMQLTTKEQHGKEEQQEEEKQEQERREDDGPIIVPELILDTVSKQADLPVPPAAAVAAAAVVSEDSGRCEHVTEQGGEMVFQRYCHVYKEGELEDLCRSVPGCRLEESGWDKGNWFVRLRKVEDLRLSNVPVAPDATVPVLAARNS